MARLTVQPDPVRAGRIVVSADHPAALAAVADALLASGAFDGVVMAAWGLHPTEQDELRSHAYADDRAELGADAQLEVVELPRPREARVVWIDRYHLVVHAARAAVATRVLGLYVGSRGELVISLHHPSVAGFVMSAVVDIPVRGRDAWDRPELLGYASALLHYDPRRPAELGLYCALGIQTAVYAALTDLAHRVRGL